MECPMKFIIPGAHGNTECYGEKCMWYVRVNDCQGCAIAWNAVSINVNLNCVDLGISNARNGDQR